MRWLGLAALSGFFAATPVLNGQAPVLTVPRNLTARDTNEVFDAVANAWVAKAPMPTARTGYLGVAAINGRIYIAGGDNVGNLCQPANILEGYDPAADSWATLQPMLHPRWDMGSAELGGLFYVVGGQTTATACGPAEKTMEAYDPATGPLGTWSAKPSMNFARRHLAVVSLNGVLYAIGGIDSANACVDYVEAFDPLANGGVGAWTTIEHLITKRGLAVAAVANGKIYVMGGTDCETSGALLSIEEYDPSTGHWTTKNATVPSSRSAFYALAVLDNKIYLMGGSVSVPSDLELFTARVDVYDPVADTFLSNPPPMLTARGDLASATVNNKIYAIGGEDFPARVGQRFVYQITATNHPTSYSVSPALPDGLTLDLDTGIISGVPTVVCPSNACSSPTAFFTFTATNASGSDSRLIYFQVGPGPLPPGLQIASSTCATGRTGQAFQFQVAAQGASSSATFTAGGLPYGPNGPELSIDPQTGLISGMISIPGDGKPVTSGVTVSVIDGGQTGTGQLQLTFVSDNTVPIINSPSAVFLVPGQPFSYTITADADGAFSDIGTFGYIGTDGIRHAEAGSTAGLPAGLHFDGKDKILGTYTGSAASSGGGIATAPSTIEAAIAVERPIRPKTLKIRPPGVGGIQTSNIVAYEGHPTGVGSLNYVPCGYTSTGAPITLTVDALPVEEDNDWVLQGGYNTDCSVTISATPDSCKYNFVNWTENGVVQYSSPSYTFTPTADRSLVANFSQITYNVSVSAGVGGTAGGAGTFSCGSSVTVTATPGLGFDFLNWTENGSVIPTAPATYQFTVSGDRTLVANFIPVVSPPVITPGGGTFKKKVLITMSCATTGASIRYTTDGTDPTNTSSLYPTSTGKKKFKGISITGKGPHTVKAKGINGGYEDSQIATAVFTIN